MAIEMQRNIDTFKKNLALSSVQEKTKKIVNNSEKSWSLSAKVKEWIKEFLEKVKDKVTFNKWIKQLWDRVPKEIKDILYSPETANKKEKIKQLQTELKENYNPSHEIPVNRDGVPWPFTLWAILNNIWWYASINKIEYKWSSDSSESYTNFIWTLPDGVVDKIKNWPDNNIKILITNFESWTLTKDIVKKAQTELSDYYLWHKNSWDWVPGQNTQNAILNYTLKLS